MSSARYERNRLALSTEQLDVGLKAKVIRGGIVNVTAQGTMIVVQLVSSAILARLLMPADYGLLAMAGTAVVLMGVLTNLGITTPTIHLFAITHEQVSTLFFINAAGGLILFLLTCLIAPLFGAI